MNKAISEKLEKDLRYLHELTLLSNDELCKHEPKNDVRTSMYLELLKVRLNQAIQ